MSKKLILPLVEGRTIRLTPPRPRETPSNLVVIEDPNGDRIDLHLTDAQLEQLKNLQPLKSA